jgi:formate dehydrogenase subunit delta
MSDIDQMIKMANQIAENFSFHEDQLARTVDHLQRFWPSKMRRKLAAHADAGGEGLSDAAMRAIGMLEA